MKEPTPRKLPSGRWFCRVRVNGKDIGITEDTPEAAKAKALALKAGLKDVARNPSHMTVGAAVDEYIEGRDGILSPSTIRAYLSYRAARFQGLMDERICDLTPAKCQKAVALEARQASAKTVRNAWGLISAAVSEADPETLLRVRLPAKQPANGKAIDPAELREIFAAIHGTRYELPLLLDAFLGLRRGELFALRKSDFDFKRGTVSITRSLVQDRAGEWVERPTTKTAAGRRTLPVEAGLLDMVKALPDDGRLFQMHPNSPYLFLRRLTEKRGLPHVRVHDFRHTFASVNHLLGVPDKYLMASGGWASKPTLDSVYTHTIEGEEKAFSDRVASFYKELLPKNGNEANEKTTEKAVSETSQSVK